MRGQTGRQKKAERDGSSPQDWLPKSCRGCIPKSKSTVIQRQRGVSKSKAAEALRRSPRYQRLCEMDPSMPSTKFCKDMTGLPRGRASLLIQLRTGHVLLARHLHRIGKAESPICPACRAHNETVHHYLLVCPALASLRKAMESQL